MPASASGSMRDSCHWTWGSLGNTNKRASPQLPTKLVHVTDPQNGEKECSFLMLKNDGLTCTNSTEWLFPGPVSSANFALQSTAHTPPELCKVQ